MPIFRKTHDALQSIRKEFNNHYQTYEVFRKTKVQPIAAAALKKTFGDFEEQQKRIQRDAFAKDALTRNECAAISPGA